MFIILPTGKSWLWHALTPKSQLSFHGPSKWSPKKDCGLLPKILSPSWSSMSISCFLGLLFLDHPKITWKIIGLGPNAAPRSFRTWAPSVASISGKPLFPMWPKQGMDGPRFPVNGLVLKLTTVATATSCATERGLNYEASLDLSPKTKIGVSKLDTFDIILRKFFSQHSKSDSPMRAPSVMFFVENFVIEWSSPWVCTFFSFKRQLSVEARYDVRVSKQNIAKKQKLLSCNAMHQRSLDC